MMIMTPAASTLIPVTVAISDSSSVMSAACVAFVVSTIIVVDALISVVEPIRTTSRHYMWRIIIPVVDAVTVTRDSPTAATLWSVPLSLTMS